MFSKKSLLKGTLLLTATGFATRLMGFFYRIFLSHAFGEEQVGLYQLIFPLYALCYSLTAAGFETAITRTVAHKLSQGKEKEARQFFLTGLFYSLLLSSITMLLLQKYAGFLSLHILKDQRCNNLLLGISYALPFAALHSCICGYYFGMQRPKIPATSQLCEQCIRILSVGLFFILLRSDRRIPSILLAVCGIVLGEIASSLYCLHQIRRNHPHGSLHILFPAIKKQSKEVWSFTLPLTANRILLNLLQSVEAISIPLQLQVYGMSASQSLRTYGVLTGMALPCILFPSAITNSLSTMLLPTVAQIQAAGKGKTLKELIRKVLFSCLCMGFGCCLFFLFFGNFLGNTIFQSATASDFLHTLAWICPFLYLNTTLLSMINGLGKVGISFSINTAALLCRIGSIWLFLPKIGIQGYLYGLLASQLLISICGILYLLLAAQTPKERR